MGHPAIFREEQDEDWFVHRDGRLMRHWHPHSIAPHCAMNLALFNGVSNETTESFDVISW